MICLKSHQLVLRTQWSEDSETHLFHTGKFLAILSILWRNLVFFRGFLPFWLLLGCFGLFFASNSIDWYHRHNDQRIQKPIAFIKVNFFGHFLQFWAIFLILWWNLVFFAVFRLFGFFLAVFGYFLSQIPSIGITDTMIRGFGNPSLSYR